MTLICPTKIVTEQDCCLLNFEYHVVYKPGESTPCDYRYRHPPKKLFTLEEIEEWIIDEGSLIMP